MIEKAWNTTKAAVGIALLVGGALYSAQKLDRQQARETAQQARRLADPATTGSLRRNAVPPAASLPATR